MIGWVTEWGRRGRAVLGTACRIGFLSARERGCAVLTLWLIAALVVITYYFIPGIQSLFEPIGRWQRSYGWRASFCFCALFSGFVPYVVYRLRQGVSRQRPLVTATAQAIWCGFCGILCGWFFSLQGRWFGCGHELSVVLRKVLVDQFVWSVFVIAPTSSAFYAVLSGGWRLKDERVSFGVFLRHVYLPFLVTNWIVGIPSNVAVYSFPMDLQIPVLGLLSSAWAVICVGLGARSGLAIRASSVPSSS